jgi:Flp pilus assembly protein TadG
MLYRMHRSVSERLASLVREATGTASVEFAFVALLLGVMLINATDLGMYIYTSMEVQNAAQVEVQSLIKNCAGQSKTPVTKSGVCTGYSGYVTTASHSTSLGTNVTAGTVQEAWYCDSAGVLSSVSTDMTATPTCSGSAGPYDYVTTTATYTYVSAFAGASVVGLLSPTISETAMMRVK